MNDLLRLALRFGHWVQGEPPISREDFLETVGATDGSSFGLD